MISFASLHFRNGERGGVQLYAYSPNDIDIKNEQVAICDHKFDSNELYGPGYMFFIELFQGYPINCPKGPCFCF